MTAAAVTLVGTTKGAEAMEELSCDLRARARQRPSGWDLDRPYVCETAKLPRRDAVVRLPCGRLGEYTLTRDEYYAQLAES